MGQGVTSAVLKCHHGLCVVQETQKASIVVHSGFIERDNKINIKVSL